SGTEGSAGESGGQLTRPLTCGNAVTAQVDDVRLASFKTVERQSLSLVGSIPIRLRHLRFFPVRRPATVRVVLTVAAAASAAEDLFTQNVGVSAVLCQFSQHM
ncbi:MAG: hypothetical protein QOJ03_2907, partial [Frankiaceae bacterium]|nr:hypothetical protein [Frankiaceae bacterium]